MTTKKKDKKLPDGSDKRDFSALSALYINCTLKPTGELSHTEGLMKKSFAIMKKHKVKVEMMRAVDFDIAPGVQHDMTKHGFEKDDWTKIFKKVMKADILILESRKKWVFRTFGATYKNYGKMAF